MSSNLTEETITEVVQRTFDTSTDDRFRQLLVSLVRAKCHCRPNINHGRTIETVEHLTVQR